MSKLLTCLTATFVMLTGQFLAPARATPDAASEIRRKIGAEFATHQLVLLAETHRNAQEHRFIQTLLKDRDAICHADDIVVEFGNSRLQSVSDRYTSGAPVSESEFQSIWRDTEQWITWDSPVYRQFFETVRADNQHKVCNHSIRILLGDPGIDWSKVKSAGDYKPSMDRDGAFADVTEKEVLAKHHRALLIAGSLHDLKRNATDENGQEQRPGLAEIIDRKHPGALFSIAVVQSADTAKALGLLPPPKLKLIVDSGFESISYAQLVPKGIMVQVAIKGEKKWVPMTDMRWPPITQMIDAVLYLGNDTTAVDPSPSIYLDPIYQVELRRRAVILKDVWGIDFLPELEDQIKKAK